MLILEDIHWADPSSIDLLNKLLPLLEESPILFCLTARPDRETAGWKLVEIAHDQSKHRLTELTLAQLTTDDSNQLIANLLNIDSLPDDLRRLILSKATRFLSKKLSVF